MKDKLKELGLLEEYMRKNDIPYERIDDNREMRHQVIVYTKDKKRQVFDAICQPGSYGYEMGLLEVMGWVVNKHIIGDTVQGDLTAEEVIELYRAIQDK